MKEKYEKWKREHEASVKCQKNFTATSSVMEKHTAKVSWERSIENYVFCYRKMVCDGK